MRRGSLAITVVLLAGIPAWAQDASKGEAVFKRCRACHAIGPAAKNKAGPVLTGIVGKKAASVPGFNYSDAMTEAAAGGLVWTEAKLAQFLDAPDAFLPNNVMASPGIKNPADLKDLIAFLKLHK
ncbi:MAG: cytochrome c family protein [Hyphomicrobium sp.]|uniref:c-type cytochrome n=1 Tax=Hyphomicrobium sp. TaxID=82 RepID=UPI001327BAE2|nr:cytochrome c family protein [Hyphomicrobium sp.]KAB2941806.1 MAG: cytochrome c family protein [Hyphomicrobium sp.]MBZ0211601.1 cytochrome c family protein [Hyphomicrobium sp.]MCZ7596419.1 cytochrome c family protein [Hyphomicrobium sp.]